MIGSFACTETERIWNGRLSRKRALNGGLDCIQPRAAGPHHEDGRNPVPCA